MNAAPDSLNNVLAQLATKLGVGVEQLWPYMVKATLVEAQVGLGIGIAFLIGAAALLVTAILRAVYDRDEFPTAFAWMGVVLLGIAGAVCVGTYYPMSVVPEAYAIQKLLP